MKKHSKHKVHRATHHLAHHKKNPARSAIGMHKKRHNPVFFGTHQTPFKMAELIAGGLIGVTVNRLVMPMLPSSVTSNNFFSTIAAFAVALGEWWAASMVSKDFGAAVGFGALMEAGSTALNTFLPQVGSVVGLSGYRGLRDFVPAQFSIPPQPAGIGLNNNPITGVSGAYPMAYGRAA